MREEIRRKMVQRLGFWTSGQEIAASLGISRAALRAEGYDIEASRRGYRLSSIPDILREDVIKGGLDTEFVGRAVIAHPSLPSTNAEAKSPRSRPPAGGGWRGTGTPPGAAYG